MAQPLKENIPPFCLSIFGTDNKFLASDVLKRWSYIKEELEKLNIKILGISSDGDSRLLKSMKISSQLGVKTSTNDIFKDCIWFSTDATEFICVQDSTHIGTKLRNRILKPSIILPIGTFLISKSHMVVLLKNYSKDNHLLTETDVNPKDRQNFQSFLKISSQLVQNLLKDKVPDSDGTVLYLKISRMIVDAYMDPDKSPINRIFDIWYSLFILRAWRASLLRSKNYNLGENFISSNAFACVELNAHAILNLIVMCRDNPQNFLPPLFSSQPCESTFRQFRSMSTTYSTQVINYVTM